MTVKKSIKLTVKIPHPSEKLFFLDFKIEREEWNKYRLADDALLRVKMIMTGFYMEETLEEFVSKIQPGKKVKLGLGIGTKPIYAVESPFKLMGKPDSKVYSTKELRESIIKEEIDFETTRATWNSYLLENGIRIKARINPISVSKTDKFDGMGNPLYLFDSGIDIKVNLPENVKSRMRKRIEARSSETPKKKKGIVVHKPGLKR